MTTHDHRTDLLPPTEPPRTTNTDRPTRLDAVRRAGTVAAMLLAPWGFVVANAGYAWVQHHGGSDETGEAALAMYATYPQLGRVAITAVLIGSLLMVPAVLGAMALARRSWTAFIGGVLVVGGYVCYFGVVLTNVLYLVMAQRGGPVADYAAVIEASESQTWTAWVFGLFVLGNLVGTLLLGLGLLRSRSVAAWVGPR